MKNKRLLILLFIFSLPVLYFLIEWLFYGGVIPTIYYIQTYDETKFRVFECNDFNLCEEGKIENVDFSSNYYLPHSILLIPDSKNIPIDYKFSGQIKVEIFFENKLIHYYVSENPLSIFRDKTKKEDYYGNHLVYLGRQKMDAGSIFAFKIGEIPFDLVRLRWDRLRNMQIKITVIKPDKNLKKFCDKVELVIVPRLVL